MRKMKYENLAWTIEDRLRASGGKPRRKSACGKMKRQRAAAAA